MARCSSCTKVDFAGLVSLRDALDTALLVDLISSSSTPGFLVCFDFLGPNRGRCTSFLLVSNFSQVRNASTYAYLTSRSSSRRSHCVPSHTCTPTRLRASAVAPVVNLRKLAVTRMSFMARKAVTRAVANEKKPSVEGSSCMLADLAMARAAAAGSSIAAEVEATSDCGDGFRRARIAVIISEI